MGLYARKRSLLAAAIVLSAPGIPMLFQGQEFMQDGYSMIGRRWTGERAETYKGIVLAHKHLICPAQERVRQHGRPDRPQLHGAAP
ncbi:MAG: hypothetical protein WDN27_05755, partial [Candidatus Saccharibacteria bacterium]